MVHDLQIVQVRQGLGPDQRPGRVEIEGTAGVGGQAQGFQGAVQHEGRLQPREGQPGVPAGEREALRGADQRNRADLEVEVQVRPHPSQDGQLLGVLLPEVAAQPRRGGWHRGMPELRDDGADAVEVPRARGPLEDLAHVARGDGDHGRVRIARVHLLQVRGEDQLAALGTQDRPVRLEGARVVLQVGRITELQRVDEHRGDDDVVLLAGLPDQGRMAAVQRTHGRDQPHGGLRLPGGDGGPHPLRERGLECSPGGVHGGQVTGNRGRLASRVLQGQAGAGGDGGAVGNAVERGHAGESTEVERGVLPIESSVGVAIGPPSAPQLPTRYLGSMRWLGPSPPPPAARGPRRS